jgi:hypothetical protein
MGECGLSISLQQLKTKVAKLTQTKATPSRMEYLATTSGTSSNINNEKLALNKQKDWRSTKHKG